MGIVSYFLIIFYLIFHISLHGHCTCTANLLVICYGIGSGTTLSNILSIMYNCVIKRSSPSSGHEINSKTHLEGKKSLLFLITELETRTFPGSLNEDCETAVKFTPIFPLNI